MRNWVLAAAAVMMMAGCADMPVTTGSFRGGANPMFTYAAAGRDLTMVVVGNPFQAPREQVASAAIGVMQGRFRAQPTTLVAAPTASARPETRLVLALDPEPDLNPDALCRAKDPGGMASRAGGPRLTALLAFCYRDLAYAEQRGSVGRPSSPDDPAFVRLLGAMATNLLPGSDATMHDILDNE